MIIGLMFSGGGALEDIASARARREFTALSQRAPKAAQLRVDGQHRLVAAGTGPGRVQSDRRANPPARGRNRDRSPTADAGLISRRDPAGTGAFRSERSTLGMQHR